MTLRLVAAGAGATLAAVAVLATLAHPSHGETRGAEVYESTIVDSTGALSIVTADHRVLVPARDSAQVGFDQVAISPDHRAVGWLVLMANCCTSYPIPLTLKVRTAGTERAIPGGHLPIWRWRFEAGSAQVSFFQETVHGGIGSRYELRAVKTGKLVAWYEPSDSVPPPPWVARLEAAQPDTIP